MENRQRTIRKLLWRITAVLAVLAVVSICFVSGTFARYVSNRSGSTVTEVAKWDIDFKNGTGAVTNNFTVKVGKLSPDMSEHGTLDLDNDDNKKSEGDDYDQRVKTITPTQPALQITNSGDVDAYLTITGAIDIAEYGTNLIYYGTYNSETAEGSNAYKNPKGAEEGELVWGTNSFADGGTPSVAQAEAVITMEFALTNTNEQSTEKAWKSYADFVKAYGQPSTNPGTDDLRWLAANGDTVETLYVWARAVWTSRDSKYYSEYYSKYSETDSTTAAAKAAAMAAAMSDGLDTWLGENIAAVGAAFTFSVVQASELPT